MHHTAFLLGAAAAAVAIATAPSASAAPSGSCLQTCHGAAANVQIVASPQAIPRLYPTTNNPKWRGVGYNPKWQEFGYNPRYSGFQPRPLVSRPPLSGVALLDPGVGVLGDTDRLGVDIASMRAKGARCHDSAAGARCAVGHPCRCDAVDSRGAVRIAAR